MRRYGSSFGGGLRLALCSSWTLAFVRFLLALLFPLALSSLRRLSERRLCSTPQHLRTTNSNSPRWQLLDAAERLERAGEMHGMALVRLLLQRARSKARK